MLIYHKGHTDTIQVYSVTVMTNVKALQAGHSSQGTSEPITPVIDITPWVVIGICHNIRPCILSVFWKNVILCKVCVKSPVFIGNM